MAQHRDLGPAFEEARDSVRGRREPERAVRRGLREVQLEEQHALARRRAERAGEAERHGGAALVGHAADDSDPPQPLVAAEGAHAAGERPQLRAVRRALVEHRLGGRPGPHVQAGLLLERRQQLDDGDLRVVGAHGRERRRRRS